MHTGCGLCGQDSLDSFWQGFNHLHAASAHDRNNTSALPDIASSTSFDGRVEDSVGFTTQLSQGFQTLRDAQTLNQQTGACHAAMWLPIATETQKPQMTQGEKPTFQWIAEDVGRHNALDKLIGKLHQLQQTFHPNSMSSDVWKNQGLVLVTSRASFEMIQKCIRLRLPALAAISAPTSLAVQLARRHQFGLYGFCREGRYSKYA